MDEEVCAGAHTGCLCCINTAVESTKGKMVEWDWTHERANEPASALTHAK